MLCGGGSTVGEGSLLRPAAGGMTSPSSRGAEGRHRSRSSSAQLLQAPGRLQCVWAGGTCPERAAGLCAPVEDCSRLGVAANDCPTLCVPEWISSEMALEGVNFLSVPTSASSQFSSSVSGTGLL